MHESDNSSGNEGLFPATELTKRLLRRATEPLGVIDTRPAQQIYDRSQRLFAEKFDLLQQINSRYGVAEATPKAIATPLARTASPVPQEDIWAGLRDAGSNKSSEPRPVFLGESGAAGGVAIESGESVTAQAVPSMQNDGAPQAPIVASGTVPAGSAPVGMVQSGTTDDGLGGKPISTVGTAPLTHVPEIRTPDAATGKTLLQRKAIVPTPATTEAAERPEYRSTATSSAVSATNSRNTPETRFEGVSSRSRELSMQPRVEEATREIGTWAEQRMVHRKQSVRQDRSEQEQIDAPTRNDARPELPGSAAPSVVVRESHAAPFSVRGTALIFRRAYAQSPGAAMKELQALSAPVDVMRVQTPGIMRVINPEGSSDNSLSHTGSPGGSERTRVDIAELTEQVSRMMARRFAVERERRGKLK